MLVAPFQAGFQPANDLQPHVHSSQAQPVQFQAPAYRAIASLPTPFPTTFQAGGLQKDMLGATSKMSPYVPSTGLDTLSATSKMSPYVPKTFTAGLTLGATMKVLQPSTSPLLSGTNSGLQPDGNREHSLQAPGPVVRTGVHNLGRPVTPARPVQPLPQTQPLPQPQPLSLPQPLPPVPRAAQPLQQTQPQPKSSAQPLQPVPQAAQPVQQTQPQALPLSPAQPLQPFPQAAQAVQPVQPAPRLSGVQKPQLQHANTLGMLSEQMENEMAQLEDRSAHHAALGRSPEEVSKHIQVVSLGSSCGVKMTMRRLGLDQATMPFDWVRTSSKGIIQWLKNDFADFFRAPFRRMEITFRDVGMTVYRCSTHSFWHDSIEELDTRQKLWRRVQRFLSLDKDEGHQTGRTLLFVRTCVSTAEVTDSEQIYQLLQQRFGKNGRKVCFLVIVDDQDRVGPILHSKHEGLMFWLKPLNSGPLADRGDGPGPYEESLVFAIKRILRDPSADCKAGEAWLQVANSAEIVNPGGPLQLKDSEAGLWCGMVLHKGEREMRMFAAFEGFSDREIAYPNLSNN